MMTPVCTHFNLNRRCVNMFVCTLVTLLFMTLGYAHPLEYFIKCCEHGFVLNDFMKCEVTPNAINLTSFKDISYGTIDINTTCSTRKWLLLSIKFFSFFLITNEGPKIMLHQILFT